MSYHYGGRAQRWPGWRTEQPERYPVTVVIFRRRETEEETKIRKELSRDHVLRQCPLGHDPGRV